MRVCVCVPVSARVSPYLGLFDGPRDAVAVKKKLRFYDVFQYLRDEKTTFLKLTGQKLFIFSLFYEILKTGVDTFHFFG